MLLQSAGQGWSTCTTFTLLIFFLSRIFLLFLGRARKRIGDEGIGHNKKDDRDNDSIAPSYI